MSQDVYDAYDGANAAFGMAAILIAGGSVLVRLSNVSKENNVESELVKDSVTMEATNE